MSKEWDRQSSKSRRERINLSRWTYEDHCDICWFGEPRGILKIETAHGKIDGHLCRACLIRIVERAEVLIENGPKGVAALADKRGG